MIRKKFVRMRSLFFNDVFNGVALSNRKVPRLHREGRQLLVQTDFRKKEMKKQNKNKKANPRYWFKKAQHSTLFQRHTTKSTPNLKLREVKNQTLWAAHARLT